MDESIRVNIQMKATEQNFPVVLFIILSTVDGTFEAVGELLLLTIQLKTRSPE